jgi:hypothetical protein
MIAKTSSFPLTVVAANAADLQADLDAAVEQAHLLALQEGGYGVVVTRRSYTEFTVSHSADVPYGTTLEREQWENLPGRACGS